MLINCILNDKNFTVWGDGHAKKDYIHADDLTVAIDSILRKRPVGIYNICKGTSHSVQEIIIHLEKMLGKKLDVTYHPSYKWDVTASLLCNQKIKDAINWEPSVTLENGIDQCLNELTQITG